MYNQTISIDLFPLHNHNCRHFNELEHELLTRLSRAYKPATYYMDIFVSPMATVFARNIAFLSGSVLAVLILLTVWDEDVLNVEHVRSLIPLFVVVNHVSPRC